MEWKTVKLGEIASYVLTKGKQEKLAIEDYISTENMLPNNGGIALASTTIPDNYTMFQVGDILISNIRPYFKKIWFASKNGGCSNDVLCIRGNEKVTPSYLYYLLSQNLFFDFVMAGSKGTKMPRGDKKQIMQFSFPLPPLETQRRIAAILSSLDDKIENNNRINRNLEEQAQALFKSWFVDFEPWGGTMPGDWREGTLGDIIEEQPKSKIQVNAAKDVKGKYPFFTSGSSIYEYNEALISGRNLYLNTGGAAGIEFYVGEAAYSTDTWCIKGIDDFTDFLYLYITSIINIIDTEYFEGSALKHLKKKPFKERKIIIPANKIKDDFNKKVVPIFDIIMNNYSENKRLAALRDTLLPKIMKGEIAL